MKFLRNPIPAIEAPPNELKAQAVQVLLLILSLHVSAQSNSGQAPQVTINPVTQVYSTYAVITGTVNPNGIPALVAAQWGLTTAYGSTGSAYPVFAMSTPTNVAVSITGLIPNTTYHVHLAATNSAGAGFSADTTLTTSEGLHTNSEVPTVMVEPASEITSLGAVVTGTVDPKGKPANCFVEWGTTTAYGSTGPMVPVPPVSTPVAVSNVMRFLSPNTTYHFRLVANNSSGSGYSEDRTMTTASTPLGQTPTAITEPATAITTSDANLWALVSPGGLFTMCFFQWGLDTNYSHSSSPTWLGSNDAQMRLYAIATNLNPGLTYHFRIVATNSAGIAYGADQTFITQGFVTNGVHIFTYLLTNGMITITRYSGPGGALLIPDSMLGLPVTAIGGGAFSNIPTLTDVTIPDSILSLGRGAFSDDLGLTNVVLPGNLTTIEDSAFRHSGLTKVVIPDTVTRIGSVAFGWCSGLLDVTLGHGVFVLGAQSFAFCPKLTRVVIPDSVVLVEDGFLDWGGPLGLFSHCTGLTNVTVGSGLAYLGTGAFVACPNLTVVLFRGNAPALNPGLFGERIFDYSESAIVYYLAGAIGWGETFASRSAMLWNARIQAGFGTVGTLPNGFWFDVVGTAGIQVKIETATDPVFGPWFPLQTGTLTNGLLHFTDNAPANTFSARFFRVCSP